MAKQIMDISQSPRFVRLAAGFGAGVGLVVLMGWLLDISTVKSVLPGFATMKANTALALLLAGLSLWWLGSPAVDARQRRLGRVAAVATILIGFVTVTEYLFGSDLGVGELLIRDDAGASGPHPAGRSAPVTALCLLALGLALLLANIRPWASESLAVLTALLSLLALVGHAYSVRAQYRAACIRRPPHRPDPVGAVPRYSLRPIPGDWSCKGSLRSLSRRSRRNGSCSDV
jgi:hypothetical protein